MKTTFLITALAVLLFTPTRAERRYGFLAESDDELLTLARSPEIHDVILGCVFKFDAPANKPGKDHTSHVTVIESYKGRFVVGEKIRVTIYAEEGPSPEKELGNLRFYFLSAPDPEAKPAVKGGFDCEWTNTLRYEEYGEPLRNLLREKLQPPAK